MTSHFFKGASASACFIAWLFPSPALQAQESFSPKATPAPAASQPAQTAAWSLGDATGLNEFLKPVKFVFSGYVDVGFTLNPAAPRDHQNFGRLLDDRSNAP